MPLDLDFEVDQLPTGKLKWEKIDKKLKNNLSFLTINVRSLTNKFSEFLSYIESVKGKISFILVTETWLNRSSDVALEIPGYNSFNYYRNDHSSVERKGGGMKLYVLDHFETNVIDIPTCNSCESLFVNCFIPGIGKIGIVCVYRPPYQLMENFYEFLTHMEDLMDSHGRNRLLLFGDFNLNTLKQNNSNVQRYINSFCSYGLQNEITIPTYVCPSDLSEKSCLDHIWHNLSAQSNGFIVEPGIADHYGALCIFQTQIGKKPIKINFRDFSRRNVNKYLENIQSEFVNFHIKNEPNEFATYISEFLLKLLNKYFPIKTKNISYKRTITPWITNNMKKCINKKHKWYKMVKENRITLRCYKKYCKTLRYLLRVARNQYYSNKLRSLGKNMKKNWRLINKLLNKSKKLLPDSFIINGITCSNPENIAEKFNEFFVNHPKNIHEKVKSPSIDFSYLINSSRDSISFENCTTSEIEKEISMMKKQGGLHDIPARFLKLCNNFIADPLSRLFNQCIEKGVFPDILKTAQITPVHKKGPKNEIQNYRPISVLMNIGKIFESIIQKRLLNYFENKGLLSANQFGFRKARSTELAVFTLIDRILPAFENKSLAICIFLDYSACFDTISREILLSKLDKYGIRGSQFQLIKSYFSNRRQCVKFGEKVSPIINQTLGVIQGSKCGPMYYDIYTSELANLCQADEFVMFADDTCLIYTGDNIDNLTNRVNDRLSTVFDWCCYNKLSLNPSKCSYMLFTNRNVENDPKIELDGKKLDRAVEFKYLGIFLDDKLKYQKHIEYLCDRMSRFCGTTFRLQKLLDIKSAKNVYYSCIYSIVIYCICVWGGVLKCSQRGSRLIRLHERCAKNLFSPFHPRVTCIFKEMKILKLADIHSLYIGIYMFKVIKLNQVPTLQVNLDLEYPNHNYETRNRDDPRCPYPRVLPIKLSFKYQCVDIWNKIPDNIKETKSLNIFKKSLTQHFLNQY